MLVGMGNSFGCSATGERLVSAARDGDLIEAKMLLEFNPCLARYSTFGGLNSPLHFASAKGHYEVGVFIFSCSEPRLLFFVWFLCFFFFGKKKSDSVQIVSLLLEHGADVNSRNYCGQVCHILLDDTNQNEN